MQPSERYDRILQQLSGQEMVTIPELMASLGVSIETVRRDLNYLEKVKKIKKVYGGAILFNRTASIIDNTHRLTERVPEKAAIGRECAGLVRDGDALYLGPGTTVLQVAKRLKELKHLTIITDSLYTALEFMDTDAELYFIGGKINTREAQTCQRIPENAWQDFHATKAIIGTSGISARYGVTDFNLSEAAGIRQMAEQALQVIVVADNSKFGVIHNYSVCPLSRVDYFITGNGKKADILRDYAHYQHHFIFAETEI